VNVLFLAEGEEIMGSPTYGAFVERYRDRLRTAQLSHCVTGAQSAHGTVSVGLGLKGMVVLELTATGKAWGRGPVATVHSSAASLVDSPPFRLAQALATLTEPDGRGCRVDGLTEAWGYRKPLTREEQRLLDALVQQYAGRDWREVLPLGGPANVPIVRAASTDTPPDQLPLRADLNVAGLRAASWVRNRHDHSFPTPRRRTGPPLGGRDLTRRDGGPHPTTPGRARLPRHQATSLGSAFGHAQAPPIIRRSARSWTRWPAWPGGRGAVGVQAAGGPVDGGAECLRRTHGARRGDRRRRGVGEHGSPSGRWRLDAEAEEGQRRLEQNQPPELEARDDQDGARRAREHLPRDQPAVGGGCGPAPDSSKVDAP
jgi:hypothetical protein